MNKLIGAVILLWSLLLGAIAIDLHRLADVATDARASVRALAHDLAAYGATSHPTAAESVEQDRILADVERDLRAFVARRSPPATRPTPAPKQ